MLHSTRGAGRVRVVRVRWKQVFLRSKREVEPHGEPGQGDTAHLSALRAKTWAGPHAPAQPSWEHDDDSEADSENRNGPDEPTPWSASQSPRGRMGPCGLLWPHDLGAS